MNIQEYNAVKNRLNAAESFDFDESFDLVRQCSALLNKPETEHYGRDMVIRVLEHFDKVYESTRETWNELVEAAGLHPYVDRKNLRGSIAIRHEFHRSRSLPSYYLHREQLMLSAYLEEGRSVIVSAPTSFGKSLLIEEVIATKQHNNIVIIQPTLALLDETRKKLEKYRDTYHLVVSTHQRPMEGRNLFLFTGERVVEYETFPLIDFFVIDEFYKLSLARDDERAATLNQALYRLLKITDRFYLLGPNIKSVSTGLTEKHDAIWHRSDYATVSVDVTKVYEGKGWRERDRKSVQGREKELFRLLPKLDEPTIIYCASPHKATELADRFSSHLDGSEADIIVPQANSDVIDWIEENLHERWSLARTLRKGIAFHHGSLPRHLGSSIVDGFNRGHIQYLFCTSTLIEGVNTTARNVILFDKQKGRKPIDFFDYKNIVGRSGRMTIHYVGKVFQFHPEPSQLDLDVDVPLFDQANAPLELLVQLEKDDIEDETKKRLAVFESLDEELKRIIKKNSGLLVDGQIAVVKEMERLAAQYSQLLTWTAIPSYRQLEATLGLCWRHFLKPKESKANVRSPGHLATLTLQYNQGRSLAFLIAKNLDYWRQREEEEDSAVQIAVSLALSVARNWFEYKLPKWLAGISELQAYVYRKQGHPAGNYSYFSALLENSFFRGALSVLMDYDVPPSALRKIEQVIGEEHDWATLEARLHRLDMGSLDLLPYERKKLEAALRMKKD
jgi:DEAD/DEAH box helicase/Helicase conserved C-terminal domain